MQQVLFWIPIKTAMTPAGIAIYGFGVMLLLAFIFGMTVATWRGRREGVESDRLYDLAFPVFIGGIIGARIVFMIQYDVPWQNFYKFWEGGIVFYGSAIGGWIGYALAWWLSFRKYKISTWKLADIVAPAVCVGLMIGRIGCLLNGCCYGHICPDGGLRYPLMTAPAKELVVGRGYQTSSGFGAVPVAPDGPPVVTAVEPASAAAQAGLKPDDIITEVNDVKIGQAHQLERLLTHDWPRGEKSLRLTVVRDTATKTLEPFVPRSLPLHPTQIYESISMALLFFVLMAFLPYRRHYGQVFVVLMLGYAVHRFFNETLRNDTDPVLLNLTLSQVGSIAVFAGGLGLELYLRRVSPRVSDAPPPPQHQPRTEEHAKRVESEVSK